VLELLVRGGGRSLAEAVMMMIPGAPAAAPPGSLYLEP